MRFIKWIGLLSAMALCIACFYPWVTIAGKNLTISGVNSAGTNLGKPGYFHFIMVLFYVPLLLLNKTWSNRLAILLCAINIGWALRNFYLITSCQGGECPVKHAGIYVELITPFIMLMGALFNVPGKVINASNSLE